MYNLKDIKEHKWCMISRELTDWDEQSSRRNYGSKETFILNGLSHLLCNKIPELDEYDGGTARRMV